MRIVEAGSPAQGIIVGSQLNGTVTLPDAGAFPIGTSLYAYPHHTINAVARDICHTTGSSTPVPAALLVRYGPNGTVDAVHTCDQMGATASFSLRQLEAVQISGEVNGPKSWVPSHY